MGYHSQRAGVLRACHADMLKYPQSARMLRSRCMAHPLKKIFSRCSGSHRRRNINRCCQRMVELGFPLVIGVIVCYLPSEIILRECRKTKKMTKKQKNKDFFGAIKPYMYKLQAKVYSNASLVCSLMNMYRLCSVFCRAFHCFAR